MTRVRTERLALWAWIALSTCGCFTLHTTALRLRDGSAVSVHGEGGAAAVLLLPGAASSTVSSGDYLVPFHRQHFEIHALRDSSGQLRLHCDGCEPASLLPRLAGFDGKKDVILVTEDAQMPPVPSSDVSSRDGEIIVSRDVCWVTRQNDTSSFCEARSKVSVAVPKDDVLQIHSHAEASRPWGAVLTTVGGFGVAAALTVVATTLSGDASTRRAGAVIGAASGVPALAVVGAGLWNLLSGSKDEYRTPPSASPP